MANGERALAIFIDFENLALGFQNRRDRFDIGRVLERLVEKGKVVAKKAYADWSRFAVYTRPLHEAAIELIEIPGRGQTGKNSADIRLVVDAMDLAYAKTHIDTFVVVSGDSDFSPLVSKLKELGKHVIGLGMQDSTSELLRDNCDEFIYYEDLDRAPSITGLDARLPETKRKVFALLLESLQALRRENKDVIWSSMIKDTMKRKKPSFNESYHGYRSFSELLEDAQQAGLLELDTDKRSRTYVVTRFGPEMQGAPRPRVERPELAEVSAPPEPVVIPTPPGLPGIEIPPGVPRRKSRRRRRRGGAGAAVNGGNAGNGVPAPVLNGPPEGVVEEPDEEGFEDDAYEAAAEAADERESEPFEEEAAAPPPVEPARPNPRHPEPRPAAREPARPAPAPPPPPPPLPVVREPEPEPEPPSPVEEPAAGPGRGRKGTASRGGRRGKAEAPPKAAPPPAEENKPAARRRSGGRTRKSPGSTPPQEAPEPPARDQGIQDDEIRFPRG